MSQIVTVQQLIPFALATQDGQLATEAEIGVRAGAGRNEFEPSEEDILSPNCSQKISRSRLHSALLENAASGGASKARA